MNKVNPKITWASVNLVRVLSLGCLPKLSNIFWSSSASLLSKSSRLIWVTLEVVRCPIECVCCLFILDEIMSSDFFELFREASKKGIFDWGEALNFETCKEKKIRLLIGSYNFRAKIQSESKLSFKSMRKNGSKQKFKSLSRRLLEANSFEAIC